MPITIGAKQDSPFTEPIGLLSDCHRRIEKFLAQLLAISREAGGGELIPDRQSALKTALDYFRGAAPLHTQDEEISLFPRIRQTGGNEVQVVLDKIEKLEADHRVADEAHAEIDRLGRRWLTEGRLEEYEAEWLLDLVEKLQAVYARHIRIEDQEVFPVAAKVLAESDLTHVGREMAIRRGLDPDNLPDAPHCRGRKSGIPLSGARR